MEAMTDSGLSQPLRALAIANDTRIRRADLKRSIRAGGVDICDVLLEPPDFVASMLVTDLLKALPRVGQQRAEVLVRGICRPTLEIGRMGAYTRSRLVDKITEVF